MLDLIVSATDNAFGSALALLSFALVVAVQAAGVGVLPEGVGRIRVVAWPFAACMCALFAARVVVLA